MSAQNINPTQSRNRSSALHKQPQIRNIAAIFSNHSQANWALDCLAKEGFNHLQIEIKPTTAFGSDREIVVVHTAHRAITALEILVNAGGDTQVNQAEWLANNA